MRKCSSLVGRLFAVVIAATLVVTPGEALAAPSSRYADIDSDGDGLLDTVDGCPTVAATTPTGCPSASRRAELRWLEGRDRLQATITSPVEACRSGARIKLWRVRPHRDIKLLAVDASSRGRYRFRVPRRARYYVTVSPSYVPGLAECGKAVSRTVRVPGD
ncbi:hypothetical protein [Nocardioides astragali]|uniref:Carboxypeptidase regulatory-like domain-containing protein n=1 Tax=Nocardioides astragali TaxID=1776736 RepID=A0ABW2N7L6_9ACTN|nr:hypothetical protein [Nocardioides astragali]